MLHIQTMQKWLDAPELLTADDNAEYAATIEINLDDIKEPILACPFCHRGLIEFDGATI
jgi:aconitate hydratase 2/2-methylisocitrate dehydratase